MPKVRWLDRRIAKPGPHLALCLSEDEFRAALRHLKCKEQVQFLGPHADATTTTLTKDDRLCCIISMGDTAERTPVEIAGLLIHESVHVWQAYVDAMGERNPGAEQEAYAIQAIAQELLAEYARRIGQV